MSSSPKYAVSPVMPSVPRYVGSGAASGSTWRTPLPSDSAYSCTPVVALTNAPTGKPSCFELTTSPMTPARMTSPICTGGT